ncbi:inaD-like protein isoform X9 [Syngnathus typhle]|uniref:inaD-like protein isoform X9 n=1 Tax=Syngnathus typhle TaxID=161592 RepID=UPI002A6A616A|nr:inaD-like protein isoform X9 [Syngnathus typhle]
MPDEAGPSQVRPTFQAISPGERRRASAALERLRAKLAQKDEWRRHLGRVAALQDTLDSPFFVHVLTLQRAVAHLKEQLSTPPEESGRSVSFSPAPPTLEAPLALGAPPSPDSLHRWIVAAAAGRPSERVSLTRPAVGGLGFSMTSLHPGSGRPDAFVKHIQPGSVADRDGRLRDQILVINGRPLEVGVSPHQALALLQLPGRTVDLTVARDRPPTDMLPLASLSPPATANDVNAAERAEVEEIQLLNDGSGLGFGIVGGKTDGVVVRTLVEGGAADRDGRLRTGDRILRVGATPTNGLGSDEVVQVLQGCGSHVSLRVARDRGTRRTKAPPPPDSAPVSVAPMRLLQCRSSGMPNLDGYEIHEVALTKKDGQSLGISIIGHNPLSSQDAVGMFIKHVVPGSAAHHSGNIRVQDRLIAMDGVSLHGLTSREVVEVMKRTGRTVLLTLVRKNNAVAFQRSSNAVESSCGSLPRSLEFKTHTTHLDTHSTSSAAELTLKTKWQRNLGPNYQLLVSAVLSELREEQEPGEVTNQEKERVELALWSSEVEVLELHKEAAGGLGFSILDYQTQTEDGQLLGDALDPSFTLIHLTGTPSRANSICDSPACMPGQHDDTEAEADSKVNGTDVESCGMIDMEKRRWRSYRGFSITRRGLPEREEGEGEESPWISHWDPPRRVEVSAKEGELLGLSIVGGHYVIKQLRNGEDLKGIFIKQVLRGSPAHATCALKTGDKILQPPSNQHNPTQSDPQAALSLGRTSHQACSNSCLTCGQVSGLDLRSATHQEAVDAIKSATSPVVFIVQSRSGQTS